MSRLLVAGVVTATLATVAIESDWPLMGLA